MKKHLFIIAALGIALQTPASAVPEYINYQARIFDATGAPLEGSKALSIAIYDATSAGNLVWGPFHCDGQQGPGHANLVSVWNGWFNIVLGPVDVADRSISTAFSHRNEAPRFIEIQVQGQPISPRQLFLSAPYAMHAAYADHALNGVSPGTIVAYVGGSAPVGWLLCNGSEIPAGSEYATLKAMIGPNTPDLRGRFILGVDGTANRVTSLIADFIGGATGEERHTLTIPEMPSHNHIWNYGTERDDSGTGGSNREFTLAAGPYSSGNPYPIANTGGGLSHNNMPPYMALNWIIKY